MKKFLTLSLVAVMAIMLFVPAMAEQVTLTYASWRSDDAERVGKLFAKYEELTGVKILFQPTVSPQYNATLRLHLENGTAADLMDTRSFATSRELFEKGWLMDVSDIPGVSTNFGQPGEGILDPWRSLDGKQYAVPYCAVSHVVYYNQDTFNKYGLKAPETFEQWMEVCKTLKDNGETVFANGIASDWDILECVFAGMLPNYIGGVENRMKYETGEYRMDDEKFTMALEDFAKIAQFLPEGFEAITNSDGPDLLKLGRAAMFIDGSWTAEAFKDFPGFGVFAIPAREGMTPGMCLHADMGITGNAATKHPEEVRKYLEWIASPEGVQIAAEYLTEGFLPIIKADIKLNSANVQTIQALNEGRVTDSRFLWNKFMDMYSEPLVAQLNAICKGESTPEAAAKAFAEAQMKIVEAGK